MSANFSELLGGMTSEEWIGAIGYSIAMIGFMFRADVMVKSAIVLACAINGLYFFAADMLITAAINGLTALRMLLSIFWRPAWLGVIFIALSLSTPLWVESADWIAVIASVNGTIAVFWLTGLMFRCAMLVSTGLLVINAWQGEAWAGVVGEGLIFIISVIRIMLWNPRVPSPT